MDCLLHPAYSLVLTFFLWWEAEIIWFLSVVDYERGLMCLYLHGSFAWEISSAKMKWLGLVISAVFWRSLQWEKPNLWGGKISVEEVRNNAKCLVRIFHLILTSRNLQTEFVHDLLCLSMTLLTRIFLKNYIPRLVLWHLK